MNEPMNEWVRGGLEGLERGVIRLANMRECVDMSGCGYERV